MKTSRTGAVSPKARPINICDAREAAQTWQTNNPKRAKAFLVEIMDFMECMVEMGVASYDAGSGTYSVSETTPHDVRIYMGTNPDKTTWADPNQGYGDKLLIVGTTYDATKKAWVDIIDRTTMCPVSDGYDPTATVAAGMIGSGVYDFTVPCPSECDPNPGSL